ncbi:MAG: hypothetical protein ABIP39_12080, partial [Polyangiaceae bacterium]
MPDVPMGEKSARFNLVIAFGLLGIVALVDYQASVISVENARWVEHTHEVIEGLDAIAASAATM